MTGTGMNGLASGCSSKVGHLIFRSRLDRSVPISTRNALRIDSRGHFFLLAGEPDELLSRQRAVMEAIGQEGVGPRLHPARVELALPGLDALDRGAEMGAVADGERGDLLGPRQRGGQRHRAADRLAHEMKLFQPGRVGHREQILDQKIERPGEVRRRNVRPPAAAHVERDQAIAIDQRRPPPRPDPGTGADPVMEQIAPRSRCQGATWSVTS